MKDNIPIIGLVKAHWARYRKSQDAIRHFEKVLKKMDGVELLSDRWKNIMDAIKHHRKVCSFHYAKAKNLQPYLEIQMVFK